MNEDAFGAAPTGAAPTTSEWSTILLPTKVRLILDVWYCILVVSYHTKGLWNKVTLEANILMIYESLCRKIAYQDDVFSRDACTIKYFVVRAMYYALLNHRKIIKDRQFALLTQMSW